MCVHCVWVCVHLVHVCVCMLERESIEDRSYEAQQRTLTERLTKTETSDLKEIEGEITFL